MAKKYNTVWEVKGVMEMMAALADQRKTSGYISRALSDHFKMEFSRNAVIGKMHRTGLSLGGKAKGYTTAHSTVVRKNHAPRLPRKVSSIISTPTDEPKPSGDISTGCRFMHGDAKDRNFCGSETEVGRSWCVFHQRVVFNQIQKKAA